MWKANGSRHREPAVIQSLVRLWEASDRISGRRLKALLPVLISALVRNKYLAADRAMELKLLAMSAATIDRSLRAVRNSQFDRRTGRARAVFSRCVFNRKLDDWAQPRPGIMVVHLNSHRGERAVGCAAQTLTLTDLYSGWTARGAVPALNGPARAPDHEKIVTCLDAMVSGLPFKLRGLALGAGMEIWRKAFLSYCACHHLEVFVSPSQDGTGCAIGYRSDPVVPRPVGSRKLEVPAAVQALMRIHELSELYINFFHCSFTRQQPLASPCMRLLDSDFLSEQDKSRLSTVSDSLDPLYLLSEIRELQKHLKILSAGFLPCGRGRPPSSSTLANRPWRTHKNAFEAAWPSILKWQLADPDQTGTAVLARLRRENPGVYREGQLRSLQRLLKQLPSPINLSQQTQMGVLNDISKVAF